MMSVRTINKSIRIGCKGLSETPLHFISRYKGDSVGRYRRYPIEIVNVLKNNTKLVKIKTRR